jgi:hypothetical protein
MFYVETTAPLGWPDGFVEKMAQNIAQPIFWQNQCIASTMEKIRPKIRATSVIEKTAHSKQGIHNLMAQFLEL